VLTMAQRTADDHVGDARRTADKLLSDARSTSEETVREARTTADALERDARHHHQEAMASLAAQRTAVQTQIEELKKTGHAYRTHLTAHLEGQLCDLGGRGRGAETKTDPAS
jgi:vacuolar-type H+-ATPase subunit H